MKIYRRFHVLTNDVEHLFPMEVVSTLSGEINEPVNGNCPFVKQIQESIELSYSPSNIQMDIYDWAALFQFHEKLNSMEWFISEVFEISRLHSQSGSMMVRTRPENHLWKLALFLMNEKKIHKSKEKFDACVSIFEKTWGNDIGFWITAQKAGNEIIFQCSSLK